MAVGAVWVEIHSILGTAGEGRNPSLSFRYLILPWFKKVPIYCVVLLVDKESFPVIGWRSLGAISRPSGVFLHHKQASLTTRLHRPSLIIILKIYFTFMKGGGQVMQRCWVNLPTLLLDRLRSRPSKRLTRTKCT